MKKELNEGLQFILDNNPEYNIIDAINEYLSNGKSIKYFYPDEKSKLTFKRQQLNIYYSKLRSNYDLIVDMMKKNREEKKLIRKELEQIKNLRGKHDDRTRV